VPAGTVAFEGDPDRAKTLLRRSEYANIGKGTYNTLAGYQPRCLRHYWPNWSTSPWESALLFLHELRVGSAPEEKAIVAVTIRQLRGGNELGIDAWVLPIDEPPGLIVEGTSFDFELGGRDEQTSRVSLRNCRFFVGQVNQADMSRFTVEYEIGGQRKVLEGQFKGGREVEITPLSPSTLERTMERGRQHNRPSSR